MKEDENTWIWRLAIPNIEEPQWEQRLELVSNVVISGEPASESSVVSVYCSDRDEAEALKGEFGGGIEKLRQVDWVAESAVPGPPVLIRQAILVTQESDHEALLRLGSQYPGREIISIPAQMAFGTGQHATTSTCLRILCDISQSVEPGWSMLDIGTGSGLLALGARSLGAGKGEVDAFDFDEVAVEIARQNAERNNINGIRFFVQDILSWQPERRYDVIAANVYSSILERSFDTIKMASNLGSSVILSGILRSQIESVVTAAEGSGVEIGKRVIRGKWAGLLGKVIAG